MNIPFHFSEINWLSLIITTAISFTLGGFWYSPILFGNRWSEQVKIRQDPEKKANAPFIFGLAVPLLFILNLFLDALIGSNSNLIEGAITGLIVSIGLIFPAIAVSYLFARRTFRLILIDAGYYVALLILSGCILAIW